MRIFFFVLELSLGIAIFLLGLNLLSTTMEGAVGVRLRSSLAALAGTKLRGAAAGLVITGLVQSSSAVSAAMVVLVHQGVFSLTQAIAVMLGANIGTTLTAQLVAFPVEKLALPLVLAGLALCAVRRRTLGPALVSLGAIFFGLSLTSAVLAPLLRTPVLQNLLLEFTETPIESVVFGAVLTVLVQSSSAVTSLAVGLVKQQALPLSVAAALALGSNVGTVVTTLVASAGRNRASRAAAYADFLFNLGGVLLVIPFYSQFLRLVCLFAADPGRQVAHAHTIFNVLTALLALPFLEVLAGLAWWWAGIGGGSKNK